MCFSAGASFGAGVVLSVIGITAIKQSRISSQMVFAGIPLIFAVQQVTEGFVWFSLLNPAYAPRLQPATYIFLTFAYIAWPSWVPLSILLLEKDTKRRKILSAGLASGLLVSVYLAYRLLTQNIHAEIIGMHISYDLGFPGSALHYAAILYFASTIIPPFISSVKKMWLFGFSIAIAYLITRIFFDDYELSIWCFFAAIISAAVFTIILDLQKYFIEGKSPDDTAPGMSTVPLK
jgi:heme/copper-type cytochrome/quinol oxidase subunit 4